MSEFSKIRVLIVDDEPLGREMLDRMLESYDEVEIVGNAKNGSEAVVAINSLQPDLIFLDIQMPDFDGFAVLNDIPKENQPAVIFVTAYDEYALRAFEIHALDYLLKPYNRRRFEESFGRALKLLSDHQPISINKEIMSLLSENVPSEQFIERVIIKLDGRVFFLKTEELVWVEAEGHYVLLHTLEKKYIFREGISKLEQKLNPRTFRRISRSAIINLDFVRELQPWAHGNYRVVLKNGIKLKLSQRYRKNIVQYFGGSL